MTRSAPFLVLALIAAPALAGAQEHGPNGAGRGGHAPAAAPARAPAAPRPAAPVRPAPPVGGARGGFSGYAPYEHAFPGGVRGPGRSAGAPGVGDRGRGAAPGFAHAGQAATAPQGDAFRGAQARGFAGGLDADRTGAGQARGFDGRAERGVAQPGVTGGDYGRGGYARGSYDRGGYDRGGARGYAGGRAIGGLQAGYARGGRGGFSYRGRDYGRFRAPLFRYPSGYGYRRYGRGQYLPRVFIYDTFFLDDYADFYLAPPPAAEYRWVRYGPDALLVDVDTGEVVDAAYGVFDDGSGSAPAPRYDGGDGSGYGYDQDDGYGARAAPYDERDGDGRYGDPRAAGPGYGDPRDADPRYGDEGDGYGPPPR